MNRIASRLERLADAFEGHGQDVRSIDHTQDPALLFRDNAFLPLAEVVDVRRHIVETYGAPSAGQAGDFYGVDLRATAPLAEFMGSTYSVVCGRHGLQPASTNPVINVFQGIDLFFISLESMIETMYRVGRAAGLRAIQLGAE